MIGYYVHRHGSGHRQRALAIARRLDGEITLLGSLGPAAGLPAPYVELARDDIPEPDPAADVTAEGALHWAPLSHPGLRERHGGLARWLASPATTLLVSDVSVEVLLLARLLSVPPVAMAQRGIRADRAHATGYDAAVAILAPWARQTQHEWPERWLAKTRWIGMVSRFDGRSRESTRCGRPGTCVVLVLGRGGHGLGPADLVEAAAVDGTHWHVLGAIAPVAGLPPDAEARLVLHGEVPDPWAMLCGADVVVAAAGASAVADVAAARVPLVAVPQSRPFGEQEEHVRVLARHGMCVAVQPWPTRSSWPALLERAVEIGGDVWAEHSDGAGAWRAASAIRELAAHRWGGSTHG